MLVCGAHVLYSVQVHLEACFCCLGSFETTLNPKFLDEALISETCGVE